MCHCIQGFQQADVWRADGSFFQVSALQPVRASGVLGTQNKVDESRRSGPLVEDLPERPHGVYMVAVNGHVHEPPETVTQVG